MANDKIKGVDKGKDGGLGSDQDQDKKETRVERVNRELVEKSNVEKDAKKNAKKLKLEIKKSLLQELQATANNIKNEFMKIKEEKENQQKVIKENNNFLSYTFIKTEYCQDTTISIVVEK